MKISFDTTNYQLRSSNALRQASAPSKIEHSEARNSNLAVAVSFKGVSPNAKNVFVGAEEGIFFKEGGVATVIKDFRGWDNSVIVTPYYNGNIEYHKSTTYNDDGSIKDKAGQPTGNVFVHKHGGVPVFTNQSLEKRTIDNIVADKANTETIPAKDTVDGTEKVVKLTKNYRKLREVATTKMAWGMAEPTDVTLYQVLNTEKEKDAATGKYTGKVIDVETNDYFVFTDATASMPKPYATAVGGYPSAKDIPTAKNWNGDAYAKFNKAFVELWPKSGVETAAIVCNDSQAAYIGYHAYQDALSKGEASPYHPSKVHITQVGHNLGVGYTATTSPRNMLVNLGASREQLQEIEDSEEYTDALKIDANMGNSNAVDKLLTPMISDSLNGDGKPDAMALQGKLRGEAEFLRAYTAVSETYAESAATNNTVAPSLYTQLNKLYEGSDERGYRFFDGIMNGLDDPNLDPYKKMPQKNYAEEITVDGKKVLPFKVFADGCEQKYSLETVLPGGIKSKTFNENFRNTQGKSAFEDMMETKRLNKINLFERLTGDFDNHPDVIAGVPGRKCSLIGHINPTWITKLKNNEEVNLVTSLGRGVDDQKGLDKVIKAFREFAQTPEGANAVLVLGGELQDGNKESEMIKKIAQEAASSPELEGRMVYVNGFTPNAPLASAGDVALFLSRREPCGLTDLEFMRYFCTPIVSNTQGLKQKNFDPRNADEKDKATSYRTYHEYNKTHDDLMGASNDFKEGFAKLLEEENKILEVKGVIAEERNKLADENVKASEKYAELKRLCADQLVIADAVNALIYAFGQQGREDAELLFKNQVKLDGTWAGNGALHPSGKSSVELYKELHSLNIPSKEMGVA